MNGYRERFNKMINSENSATLANDNVYMMKYSIVKENYRQITIKELITAWGLHRHFNHMIEHLSNLAPDKINTMVAVQYDIGAYDVNHDEQKMLYFAVTNNKGEHIINGGILFQHGQMSFHT